jgi:hypothetical protein
LYLPISQFLGLEVGIRQVTPGSIQKVYLPGIANSIGYRLTRNTLMFHTDDDDAKPYNQIDVLLTTSIKLTILFTT